MPWAFKRQGRVTRIPYHKYYLARLKPSVANVQIVEIVYVMLLSDLIIDIFGDN